MKKSKEVMRRFSAILLSLLVVMNMVPSAVFALDAQPNGMPDDLGSVVTVDPDAPVVDPDAPVVDPDAPVVDPDAPVVDPDAPVVDPDEPVVDPDAPVVDPDEPVVDPDEPVVDPDAPVVDPDAPVVDPDAPVVDPDAPIVDPDAPVVDPDAPVVDPDAPVVDPDAPVVDPDAPVVDPDAPVVDPDEPVVDPDAPVVDPDAPVVDPDAPVVDPDAPVVDPDAPVVDPDAPVVDPDAPVVDPDAPVVDPDAPVVDPDAPVVDPDAPVVDPDAPVVDPDAPVIDPNAPAEGLPIEGLVDVGGQPMGEPLEPVKQVKALRAPLTRSAEDFTALAMFTPEPDATSTQWIDNEDGTADSLSGHTFFMEMRFTKSEGADDVETKVFTLTGDNLDTLNLASAFPEDDTDIPLLSNDEGINLVGSLHKVIDETTGEITAYEITVKVSGEGAANYPLPLNFKSHSNGGSVTISGGDAPDGTISTVDEIVKDPTLSASNTVSVSAGSPYYQNLENKTSSQTISFKSTTTPSTNSSSNVSIPYLDSVTVTQTVTFKRFALKTQPTPSFAETLGANDTRNVEYLTDPVTGDYTGYVVTVTRTRAEGQTGELTLPKITSTFTAKKSNYVPKSSDYDGTTSGIGSNQTVSVTSTVSGTPVNSDDVIGPVSAEKASQTASRYSNITWTIDGVDGQSPERNNTRTNGDPGTSNVTNYNIKATITSAGNSTHFVLQGEGKTGSSNMIGTEYRNQFDNEISDLVIKDRDGNVICPDLATAYARGMVDREDNGDGTYTYRMKYDSTSKQSYIPIKNENGSMWWDNTYVLDLKLKTTVKLDENNVAEHPSGTNSRIRFFMAYGTSESSYALPVKNSPVNSKAGLVTSLYMDVNSTLAAMEVAKTGVYDPKTSIVTYTASVYNNSPSAEVGEIIDHWPTSIKLQSLTGVANTIIELTYTDGTSETFESLSSTFNYTGTKTVNQIRVHGFTVAAATMGEDGITVITPGTKSIKIIGLTDSNTPFTVGNTVTDGPGGNSDVERLVLADVITKNVYSDEACEDPIEGVETVEKGGTVYFKVELTNKSKDLQDRPQAMPFRLFDRAQIGMTFVKATYLNDNTVIELEDLEDFTVNGDTANDTVNKMYPEVVIPGNGTGVWVMEYQIDDDCPVNKLINLVYANAYVRDESMGFEEAFRTQNAEATVTISRDQSADIAIDKRVSEYVYHEGSLRYEEEYGCSLLYGTYVTKSDTYDVGDYVYYQIGVNNKATAEDDAPIAYIYDDLPDGLEYVGIADGWSSPIRPMAATATTRDRRGMWWAYTHQYTGTNSDYGTTIAEGTDIAYAYKKSITGDKFSTTSTTGDYVATKELAGTVRYAGLDEQGRLKFDVAELNGDELELAPGEAFWFAIICRVTEIPTDRDENDRPRYHNVCGAQSMAWAVSSEDPDVESVEDAVDIYYDHTVSDDDIEKTADAYDYNNGTGVNLHNDLVTVNQIASIRYNITIKNTNSANSYFEKIEFFDKVPPVNYTYKEGSLAWLNGSTAVPLTEVTYDAESGVISAVLDTEHNAEVYQRIYDKASFHLVYWVDPTEHGRETYHSDNNVAWLGSGPRADWTTYALGSYGVILHKSQTIEQPEGPVTYTDATPVPVHEKEVFTYTLSAKPAYDKDRYTISKIKFEDELPNINDGRDSEFGVTFADPDNDSDVVVKITDSNSNVITIDPTYYTVDKSGYHLTVVFSTDFNAAYSATVGACESFEISFPVKAEVLSSATSSDDSPFNASGANKVARNVYDLSYTLSDNQGSPDVDIEIHSNEVDVKTMGAKASVEAVKALADADDATAAEKSFTFVLAAGTNTAGNDVEGVPIETPMPETTTKTLNDAGTATFGDIVFKYPGAYSYTITENDPGDRWVASGSPVEATVTIVEDEDGNLSLDSVTYKDGTNVITNTYANKIDITVRKVWNDNNDANHGRPESVQVQLKADGEAVGQPQTLDEAGEWSYTWTGLDETRGGQAISYTVEEIGLPSNYRLEGVTGSASEGFVITNTYDVQPVSVTLGGKKIFTGWPSGESDPTFTFVLKQGNTTVGEATVDGAGTFSFDPLQFDTVGTYNYTVTEVAGSNEGIDYDDAVFNVTVTVTDPKTGTLAATVQVNGSAYTGDSITFTNPYDADPVKVTLKGQKTFSGTWPSDQPDPEFTIVLADSTGAVVEEKIVHGTETYSFTELEFTAVGTYTYTVSETPGDNPGIDYDDNVYDVTITVTDPGTGKLSAAISGDTTTGEDLYFENTYGVEDVDVILKGKKTLEGWPENVTAPTFTFVLKQGETEVDSKTTNGAGTFTFKKLSYSAPGTYTYTVSETAGSAEGVTYDETSYTVKVEVTDNLNGTLSAVVTVGGQTYTDELISFTNTYEADPVKVTLKGKKTFSGTWPSDQPDPEFTIVLADSTGAVVEEKTVHGTETYSFTELEFTAVGEYTYTVSETPGDNPGIDYDDTEYTVTITVSDPGTGKLSAAISGDTTTGTDLDFENTYGVEDVDVILKGKKTLEGWPANVTAPTFTFVLKQGESEIDSKTTNGGGDITFKKLSYSAPGTYTYTVSETAGDAEGVTYDETSYTVTVEVIDNLNGTLSAVVKVGGQDYTDELISFTNEYGADPVKVPLSGKKTLTGWPADQTAPEFTIVLADSTGAIVEEKTVHGTETYSFTELEFTTVGEYTYTVSETPGDNAGIKYDETEYTVTITVSDPGTGKLSAAISGDTTTGDDLDFTNKYGAKEVDVVLKGKKTFTGWPETVSPAPAFTFVLKQGETEVDSKTINGGGEFSFKTLTFDTVGTYTYTVTETKGEAGGVKYDEDTVHTVVIEVGDPGNGQLTKTVTVDGEAYTDLLISFTNEYEADPVEVTLKGKKTFTGWPENVELPTFEFVLKQGETEVDKQTTQGSGDITFKTLSFDTVGTYTYTVSETPGDNAGIDYDETSYEVTVTVTDPGTGKLVAAIEGANDDGSGLDFVNYYGTKPATVVLKGKKTLEGWPASVTAPTFTFTLNQGEAEVDSKTTNGTGDFSFDTLTFETAGTFNYTVKETAANDGGMTYDDTVYSVVVAVDDPGDGQLVATVTVDGEAYTDLLISFTNEYEADPVDVVLKGKKTFTGTWPENVDEPVFEFVLKEGEAEVDKKTTQGSGDFTFKTLEFDTVGTYTYTVSETPGDNAGIDYDETSYEVTVTVTDPGTGKLSASIEGANNDGSGLDFVNSYDTKPAEVVLKGSKAFTGWPGSVTPAPTFTFTLNQGETEVDSKTTVGAGEITFKTLSFDTPGTYTYTVKETDSGAGGVTYDKTVYTVTIEVSDPADGQLVAAVKVDGADYTDQLISFSNTYEAEPVDVVLKGSKAFTGTWPENIDEPVFEFVLKEGETEVDKKTAQGSGEFTFKTLSFDTVGTYTYTVSETGGDNAGITYDEDVYSVTVTVSDPGTGKLTASISGDTATGTDLDFENSYASKPVDVTLKGVKTLEHYPEKALEENVPQFTFTLTDGEGNKVDEKTVTHSGEYAFDKLTFETPGTYNYTVAETEGEAGGVTYDKTVYTVVIEVTDPADGQLVAAVTTDGNDSDGSGLDFTNDYQPDPVDVVFGGNKTLKDFPSGADEANIPTFTFRLADADDNEIGVKNVKKQGAYEFDPITFTEVGEYDYVVTEVKGTADGVSYDSASYNVKVTVTDPGDGQLVATISGDSATGDDLDFENSYSPDSVDVVLGGIKNLEDYPEDVPAANVPVFTFTLKDGADAVVDQKNVTGNGSYKFKTLTFDEVGIYNYTVTEEAGTAGGVTYDDTVYHVTVTVTDDGGGYLAASLSGDTTTGSDIDFNNPYKAAPVSVVFEGVKTLKGAALEASDFSFVLSGDGTDVKVSNDADGKIVFPEITYDEVGVHDYTVSEVIGAEGGITWDETVYEFTVTVTDPGDGQLVATVSGDTTTAKDLDFTNFYGEEPPVPPVTPPTPPEPPIIPDEPPVTPDEPPVTPGEPPEVIDEPDVPLGGPDVPEIIDEPDVPLAGLPQTGAEWMDTILTALAGLSLIAAALWLRRKEKKQ